MDTYGLKYTSGNITREGVVYKLNILQRDYTGDPLEIGDLQALSLEVQGASGGVDQPIVKTLLHFTVADTVDMGTVGGVKHGGWEEFYTPDATKYRVRLQRDGVNMWEGYITPDSWSDSLVYRGSVTITARDNVGHMRDFEFSKAALLEWMSYLGGDSYDRVQDDNLVSVYELIFAAFNIAGVPMTLRPNWDAEDPDAEPHLKAGTQDAKDWLVDIDALTDMDWYEAVEKVLVGAGLVLRYTDRNSICLMSLRALHKMGNAGTPPAFAANFVNRSGHRTLDPAYKQIVEKLNYDAVEGFEAKWKQGDFTETDRGYWKDVSALSSASVWTQVDSTKEVLEYGDPTVLPVNGDVSGEEDSYMLLASRTANPQTTYNEQRVAYIDLNNYVWYRKRLSPGTIVSVGFELAHFYKGDGSVLYDTMLPAGTIRYAILWRKGNGDYLSLQGDTWGEGVGIIEQTIPQRAGFTDGMSDADNVEVSNNFQTPDVGGFLELRIYPFLNIIGDAEREVFTDNDWVDGHIRMGNITIDINSEAVPRYFKTTTVYDESQNYTLKRDVDFGAVPTRYTTAGTIRNGFYKDDAAGGYPSIMNCHWDGDSQELPLPVLNHLQILSLHAKANNILTGELRDAAGTPIRWDGNWTYAGRTFLLISGIWNILTGRVQDAMLREFDTYEDAIGSIEADYETDLSGGDARLMALQKSVNAAASLAKNNAGGSGGGGGGGSVTSVALTMPDAFSVSGSPVTGDGTLIVTLKNTYKIPTTTEWGAVDNAKHSHNNKSILDGIQQEEINEWDAAYYYAHHHSNKSTLDTIGSNEVSSWNSAAANAHTHSNKSVLDGITQNDIDAWDAAAAGGSQSIDLSIGGTAAAPTIAAELGNGASDSVALPIAGSSQSGLVTNGTQTIAGDKTFGTIRVTRIYIGPTAYLEWDSNAGAVKLVGSIYATGDVAAGE